MSIDVARARADTPGTESVAHLNNAGAALPPAPVLDAVIEHLRLEARDRRLRGGRRARPTASSTPTTPIARLIGADRDEIAIVENATRAWDMAFYSLRLQAGRPHPDHAAPSTPATTSRSCRSPTAPAPSSRWSPDDERGQVDVDAPRRRCSTSA